MLAVQGTVVPATNADVKLWAELEDGRRIEGESQIGHASSPIVRLGCTPERPPALPKAIEAIAHADRLDSLHLFHAVAGELHSRLNNHRAAAESYRRALALARVGPEQSHLSRLLERAEDSA